MAKISSYSNAGTPTLVDKLIGTEVGATPTDATKNFTIQQSLGLLGGGSAGAIITLPTYANDVAAGVGGLVTGQLYQTAGAVMIKL